MELFSRYLVALTMEGRLDCVSDISLLSYCCGTITALRLDPLKFLTDEYTTKKNVGDLKKLEAPLLEQIKPANKSGLDPITATT